jgi:putative transposase
MRAWPLLVGSSATALLGKDAGGLSASTVARLKDAWVDEHVRWSKRDLTAKRYVYFWVDGIHVQARLEDDAQCLLVIVGATPEGKKEFVGLADGVRESTQSWEEMLLDLRRRGLTIGPELAVADGALGFWKALEEVWPKTRGQRCWVHKTANVLNKLPKSQQAKASAHWSRSGWPGPRRMLSSHSTRSAKSTTLNTKRRSNA